MTKEELLELLRADRPNQVIHEVTSFRSHPLSNYGMEYEVDVVMEADMLGTKIRRVHISGLPYPLKPYLDLRKKWEEQTLEQSLEDLNRNLEHLEQKPKDLNGNADE